jgi:hypothetical protein
MKEEGQLMDEREEQELQRPETWDDESAEVLPPVKAPRAIVSVAFSGADFARVAEYARRHGMKTSEFIRTAALDRVAGGGGDRTVITSITDGRGGFTNGGYAITGGARSLTLAEERDAVTP